MRGLEARTYLERQVSEGKSGREAMQALNRYVAQSVWRMWQQCKPTARATVDESVAA